MTTNRFVCVHGHFYQPPRESPWLEAIEVQDSAYPYHDWNERITAECYAPNAVSRILDEEKRILLLSNNYARMSFNFGPTLLSWMQVNAPDVYVKIIEADRASRTHFGGHGSAIAQAYGHLILPLANVRDKHTQVLWGIRDFETRFGRAPEGMWIPETAVDLETLDVLAEHGIRFTILAPHQAARVRPIGSDSWTDVSGARVDSRVPYVCVLPSGRRINLFFYDGAASRAVAFEGLLDSGQQLSARLRAGVPDGAERPQLSHIATDGESYGHHHRHGDMALAWALQELGSAHDTKLTNYGQFLDLCPPTQEVEIFERTSWSCAHGIERWRSDCGCRMGGTATHQRWRAPLREALDWLRDTIGPVYEREAAHLLKDPWAARDAYIDLVLDRSAAAVDAFFQRHATRPLEPAERARALKFLELQRHAMLMYTSCGWFFNDVSGIETVQVLRYAGRALHLAEQLGATPPLEEEFKRRLEAAPSNVERHQNGRRIYETFVRPAKVGLRWVAAHYAFSSLFQSYADLADVYAFRVKREESREVVAGRAKLTYGRIQVESKITGETAPLTYAAVHLGDQNFHGGVMPASNGAADPGAAFRDVTQAFERARLTEVIGLLNEQFGEHTFAIHELFPDEQRKIVRLVLQNTLTDVENSFRRLYERYSPLLRFMVDLGQPLPAAFRAVGEFVHNQTLRRLFQAARLDAPLIRTLLEEVARDELPLDTQGLAYEFRNHIDRAMQDFAQAPSELRRVELVAQSTGFLRELPFDVDLWRAQNLFYGILEGSFPDMRARAEKDKDEVAARWVERFRAIGHDLKVRVPA